MLPEFGTKAFSDYLNDLVNPNTDNKHRFYDQSVEHMKEMGVHMTGDNPEKLLSIKRPNESKEAREYRLNSYKPKTKASAGKVTSVINRIYNERLYSIEWAESPVSTIDDNDLKDYLSEDMPYYVSLMNYIKSVFTKLHLKDPNGVVGILPSDFNQPDTEIFNPIPIFYMSNQVLDFKDNEYYVIQTSEIDETKDNPIEIIIYTINKIIVLTRKLRNQKWQTAYEYDHNFGVVTAFRVGGVVADASPPQLYESHIAAVLPHWDDAVSMFSDVTAAIVNHLYPEKWEFTVDCDNKGCHNGTIIIHDTHAGKDVETECKRCSGTGKITSKSPFNIYQVNREAINPEAPLPTPPFGYGEKELESTKLLVEYANAEIQKGYEAINMDILNKVGENQSGTAKVIDRQDLDGFLSVYASHIFNYVLPNMILGIMLWRYGRVFESLKNIEAYFPIIKQPTTFDVYSISLMSEEFGQLKESGVTGAFLAGIQKDIIEKRFPDEYSKQFYKTIMDIDPLGTLTEDQILASMRVILREDLYMHTYAKPLVELAIENNDKFLDLSLNEKKEIIAKLASQELNKLPVIEPQPNEPSE